MQRGSRRARPGNLGRAILRTVFEPTRRIVHAPHPRFHGLAGPHLRVTAEPQFAGKRD